MWKTGDHVLIGYAGRTVPGRIVLASSNGVSLMLEFEAMLGGHLGMMPVLRGEDRVYRSIVTNEAVTIRSSPRPPLSS